MDLSLRRRRLTAGGEKRKVSCIYVVVIIFKNEWLVEAGDSQPPISCPVSTAFCFTYHRVIMSRNIPLVKTLLRHMQNENDCVVVGDVTAGGSQFW